MMSGTRAGSAPGAQGGGASPSLIVASLSCNIRQVWGVSLLHAGFGALDQVSCLDSLEGVNEQDDLPHP